MSTNSFMLLPIGSGSRRDTSDLFSFDFAKKSQNSKSSSRKVARDRGRPHVSRSSPRRSSIPTTPKVQGITKKGRKLSSISSPTFNSKRTTSAADAGSPPVQRHRQAEDNRKASKTEGKSNQRKKEQSLKTKRKLTESGGNNVDVQSQSNAHVSRNMPSSSTSEVKDGSDESPSVPSPPKKFKSKSESTTASESSANNGKNRGEGKAKGATGSTITTMTLRGRGTLPLVRLERLQFSQFKSEVPERVVTNSDMHESENGIAEAETSLTDVEEVNVINFNVVEDGESYRSLRNSEKTKNEIAVDESLTKSFASFVSPEFGSRHEEFPGVSYSLINASDSLKVGYITISPKTVRPFDCMENVQLLYWILSGTVTIRSTGGYYTKGEEPNKSNFLFGKSLSKNSCIMIPPNCCFTVENWEEEPSLIGYCSVVGDA